MLGDIVLNGSFPADELERERQVILHEYTEDEDDAMSTAFKLFDKACYGAHPVARSVIGTRRSIGSFTRDDVLDYVHGHYTGANVVVAVAGNVRGRAGGTAGRSRPSARCAAGDENRVPPPDLPWAACGTRRLAGCPQTHLVLGFPIPALGGDHHASRVAAALFGEGMSSPLMDELRERRALVYYAACSADVSELCGQFVIEASTAPEHVDEFFVQVMRLLHEHAERTDARGAAARAQPDRRARLRLRERPARRLEAAAMDLFALGRVRSRAELAAAMRSVQAGAGARRLRAACSTRMPVRGDDRQAARRPEASVCSSASATAPA